jgi:hypothetical protein
MEPVETRFDIAHKLVTQLSISLITMTAATMSARLLLTISRSVAPYLTPNIENNKLVDNETSSNPMELIVKLFGFACAIGRLRGDIAKTAILQWIAAVTIDLFHENVLLSILPSIARFLYRVQELLDFSNSIDENNQKNDVINVNHNQNPNFVLSTVRALA